MIMKINYEVIADAISGDEVIKATFEDNNMIMIIPKDESNSDYQRDLRWLENPDAEENGTIS